MDSPISGLSCSNSSIVKTAINNTEQVTFHNEKQFLENVAEDELRLEIDIQAISEHGKKLNEYYKKLDATDNSKGISGLKQVVRYLASKTSEEPLDNFMKIAEEFNKAESSTASEENSSYFQKLFTDVKNLEDKDLNTDKWLTTLSSLENIEAKSINSTEAQKSFIDTTEKIINQKGQQDSDSDNYDEELEEEVFNDFVNMVKYLAKDVPHQEKLSEFYSSVSKSNNLAEMKTAIQEYGYNMINKL